MTRIFIFLCFCNYSSSSSPHTSNRQPLQMPSTFPWIPITLKISMVPITCAWREPHRNRPPNLRRCFTHWRRRHQKRIWPRRRQRRPLRSVWSMPPYRTVPPLSRPHLPRPNCHRIQHYLRRSHWRQIRQRKMWRLCRQRHRSSALDRTNVSYNMNGFSMISIAHSKHFMFLQKKS